MVKGLGENLRTSHVKILDSLDGRGYIFNGGVFCTMKQLSDDTIKKFWAKVEKTDGCWNWKGRGNFHHYPTPGVMKQIVPRRQSYKLAYGHIPMNTTVFQSCGNKICVNPDHLILKSISDKIKNLSGLNRQTILKSFGTLFR